MDRYDHLNLI
jgi:hypothetical protein